MSVASPVIDYIDGTNRRIHLLQGVENFYPIEDIYHEYRYRRRTDEELRKYEPLLRAEGNVPKGGGAYTPRYVVLLDGTKIVPYNEPVQLNQLGDMITDNPDVDATLYDVSGLTVPKPIFIKPSEAEIIQLNSSNIEFSSFNGGVTIDVNNITGRAESGTKFPAGTEQQPVNNLDDLHTILVNRGFNKIFIKGDLLLDDTGFNWSGYEFIGESSARTTITVVPEVIADSCEYRECFLIGTLDGKSQVRNSLLGNVNYIEGFITNCSISPAATITIGTTTTAHILQCFSGQPGVGTPTIDMNSTGDLALRDYNGGIKLVNSNEGAHSIDMASGQVILDSTTVTGGTFVVRGVGKLIDENGTYIKTGTWNGGVTIINELLVAGDLQGTGGGDSTWTEDEKNKVIQYSKKASDNAEQINLKL